MKKFDIEQQRKDFDEWLLTHPDNLDITRYEENIMFDAWLAAQQQEGYVMVPVEPTEAMIMSSYDRHGDYVGDGVPRDIYKAMIQAAQE